MTCSVNMQLHDIQLTQANPMLYMYHSGRAVSDTGASTVVCGGDRLQVTAMVHHSEVQQQPSRKILNLFSCMSLLLLLHAV